MQKNLLFFLLLVCSCQLVAQSKRKVSCNYYTQHWKPCAEKEAMIMGCVKTISDTSYEWCYYQYAGPAIMVKTYKDARGTILHGYSAFFSSSGLIDSSGRYANGLRHGWWSYYAEKKSKLYKQTLFENGIAVATRDSADINRMTEENKMKQGKEIDAIFKKENGNWEKYVQKRMSIPLRAAQLKAAGTVIVQFAIAEDGSTDNVYVVRSVEYSLDEKLMQVIKDAQGWKPATRDGKYVKAFRRQSITISY